MVKAIYADTWDGLTLKMVGYYHDHCYHHYTGTCADIPKKFEKFRKNNIKFVFVFEEDDI